VSYVASTAVVLCRSLTPDTAHTLVHAITVIHSRVNYFNAILVGVSDDVIRKLRTVLHAAARLVTGTRLNEHITLTLRDTLYWLPDAVRDLGVILN